MRRLFTSPSAIAALVATVATVAIAAPAAAQHQHGAKPDSAKQEKPMMNHDMGGMKNDMGAMKGAAWKEMDAFHAVLAGTFHPASDKGDLAPLKAKAQDLADKAAAWTASSAPASCAKPEQAKAIASIADQSRELVAKVKASSPDQELTERISTIHTAFEKVEMACGGMNGMGGMKH